jgi:putative hydrolase of the HAD superfamily
VGIDGERARELARHARERYIDGSRGWELFDDTVPALTELRAAGWRHAILSNHVPELPGLIGALGLSGLVDVVLTSAITGYEKPHPEAFALAFEASGQPEQAWMVGDNPIADVEGAQAAGIPAILVRTRPGRVDRHAPDALHAAAIIRAGAPTGGRRSRASAT